jgi:small multidrug resistance pump
MNYLYLSLAILSEVIATSTLKMTETFTKITPTIIVVIGYSLAFFFLNLSIRTIPLGLAYAIWCAGGIILIVITGAVIYKQSVDVPAIIGLTLIVLGISIIYLFSKRTSI